MERKNIPASLKVVIILWAAAGIYALYRVVPAVILGRFPMQLDVLGVAIVFGLWKLIPFWRLCAIVLSWIAIGILGFSVISLIQHGQVPGPEMTLVILVYIVGHIISLVVLSKKDIKELFSDARKTA